MSIEFVDEALIFFQDQSSVLGVSNNGDMNECILRASEVGRLRFAEAILQIILRESTVLPERVVLGALSAIGDPFATMLSYSLFSLECPAELRASVIRLIRNIFVEIFAKRCEPLLAHKATGEIPRWNLLCFMWWEVLPRHGIPPINELVWSDIAILNLMGDLLESNHIACQEAALHGLALWQSAYPEKVLEIIEQHASSIAPILCAYAAKAKVGDLI